MDPVMIDQCEPSSARNQIKGSDGNLVVVVSDENSGLEGVNDPKPARLKKSLVKGKNKKRKKSSGNRIVCSYDQIIEARPVRLSDEEFDLEMEFSEFLN